MSQPTRILLALAALSSSALAQRDLKEIPNPSPELQQSSFQMAEGFEINLFAADPMIAKPVQMNWDQRGRLWVVSSKVYPHIKPGQEETDEILVLEDTDGDGKADKSTVFASGLLIPTGVMPGDGGAYVANSTEMLFFQDTNGDGKADKRTILLSGFGTEDTHHIIHTFRGGPDGMLYFNQSIYIHSHVETPWGVRRLLGGGLWHFRPETRELEVYSQGFVNPWGHAFDRWGQSFGTDGAYGEGINYVFPGSVFVTAVGAKRIMSGLNPGQPKHCGLAIVSGSHFPEAWQGRLITDDFRGHRVNSFTVSEEGSGYVSRQTEDLVRTTHGAFRPIDVQSGPDGALYIADWYNPIIQHGEVDFRDPRRDQERGRIWRVTAKGRPLQPKPSIAGEPVEILLEKLKSPDDWTRHFAKRELRERGAPAVLPALQSWAAKLGDTPDDEHHRLEALWTHQGLNLLPVDLLKRTLASKDYHARAAATRILYHWHGRVPDAFDLLAKAVADDHPRVRLEAVHALRNLGGVKAFEAAMSALDKPMDKNLDFALWTTARALEQAWLPALTEGKLELTKKPAQLNFALRATENPAALKPLIASFKRGEIAGAQVEETLKLIGELGSVEELNFLIGLALDAADTGRQTQALAAATQATRVRKITPSARVAELSKLLESNHLGLRAQAALALGLWKAEGAAGALEKMVRGETQVNSLLLNALEGLAALGAKDTLIALSKDLAQPAARASAASALATVDLAAGAAEAVRVLGAAEGTDGLAALFDAFLTRKEGPAALAKALAGQTLPRPVAYLGLQKTGASGNKSEELTVAIMKAGGVEPLAQQLSPEETMKLAEEVKRDGDPRRGESIYRRAELQCMVCHSLGGVGGNLGPDLVSLGASAPIDYIIDSLLEPGKKVKEGFHLTVVTTKAGQVHSGFIAREDNQNVVVRDATGAEHAVPKGEIAKREIAPVSLMPAGLTASLRRDEFRDLTRFLSELGKEGAYKVSAARQVRRWRVFHDSDAVAEAVRQGDQRFFAEPDARQDWRPAHGKVDGGLPLSELPTIKRWLVPITPLRFEVEVTTPGLVGLKFGQAQGYRVWVGKNEVQPKDSMLTLDLAAGTHVVTVVLDRGVIREGDWKAELVDAPGSAAQARLVGGL